MNRLAKFLYTTKFKERASKIIADKKQVNEIADNAKKKLIEKHLDNLKDELLIIIKMVKKTISGEYKDVKTSTIITLVAALLYFVSPIDAISDFFAGIGFMDDAFVVSLVYSQLKEEIDTFKLWFNTKKIEE